MQVSTLVSLALYVGAFVLYQATPKEVFTDPASVRLWVFIVIAMVGVIAGNIRSIALMTMVTVLIEEDRRDKANGLVGTASGVSFLVTSVISGLLVAAGDMFYVLLLAMAVMVAARRAPGPGQGGRPPPGATASWSSPRRPASPTPARSTSAAPSGWSAACRACWP